MSDDRDRQIQRIYKELDLDTDEKRSRFLQFNYKEPKIDYSKFIKITKVTTETK